MKKVIFTITRNFFFVSFCPKNTWNRIFGKLKLFPNFLRDHAPAPNPPPPSTTRTLLNWLAPSDLPFIYTACHVLLHTWKLLLKTLIRYQDLKDQETTPWRFHCTLRIPVSLWDWDFHPWPLKALNIYIERWIYVPRNEEEENHKVYQDSWGGSLQ